MRVFKSKWFQKWATGEGLDDEALLSAVEEMESGLIDARLGGHVGARQTRWFTYPGGLPAG